jgi:hypothetical protein
MNRGLLYITWGDQRGLIRSCQSAQQWHPEIPRHIVKLGDDATLLDKAKMYDLSPFDTTLFLDADTVVMGKLDYAFDKAEQHGLAAAICECPWARRFPALRDRGDIQEYNTGVVAFTRRAKPVFDMWKELADIDSSIVFQAKTGLSTMHYNDQAGFAAAIDDTGFNPFVLSMNWNFRPIWQKSMFGEIKIWHDYGDPHEDLYKWNASQVDSDSIIKYGKLEK